MKELNYEDISLIPKKCIVDSRTNCVHLRRPAFSTASLPKGAYQGDPPIPPGALPTIAVDRMLVARDDVPEDVIRTITGVLF